MTKRVAPIQAEVLASKIDKLKNFELPELFDEFAAQPRLLGALWFLQWVSWPDNYPGGLTKFTSDFVAASSEKLMTVQMAKHRAGEFYHLPQAVEVLRDLPYEYQSELLGPNTELFRDAFLSDQVDDEWSEPVDSRRARANRKEWAPQFLAAMSPTRVRALCSAAAAQGNLAEYFKRLCEKPLVSFLWHKEPRYGDESAVTGSPWYFANVGNVLLDFIDARRETLRVQLAETEVTKTVFQWMTRCLDARLAVMLSGKSRWGKTEALKLRVDMDPGDFRLIDTPPQGALGDLLLEVAKRLGMEVGARNKADAILKARIDYVLRHSNLVLCFDECQYLLPGSFTRNTAPARLNWVRHSILNRKMPAVFACTPQSYGPAKERFLKKTGYAMEQFDERIYSVELPLGLPQSELLAIARIHFPELSENQLGFVVKTVLLSKRNYVSDMERIAKLSNCIAREAGRPRPLLCDIEAAIAVAIPALAAAPTAPLEPFDPAPRKRSAKPLQASREPVATFPSNRRETRPLALQT